MEITLTILLDAQQQNMLNANKLKKINQILQTISKINYQLLIASDEKKLCQQICNCLIKIKGYEFVWVGLKDSSSDEITPFAIAGNKKDFIKDIKNSWKRYGFNGSPTGISLKSGKPFLIEDLKSEKRYVSWDKIAIERGFLSVLVLPVKYYDEVIGTLHIYSDIKNYFIEEEVKFLREVAGNISTGIKSIRNEKKLVEGKGEYEELFKRISSCIVVHTAADNGNDFIIKDFNRAAEKTGRLKREDVIGKSVLKVFPGIKDSGLFDVLKRVYKTGKSKNLPTLFYKDKRISSCGESFIYKLPNGVDSASNLPGNPVQTCHLFR